MYQEKLYVLIYFCWRQTDVKQTYVLVLQPTRPCFFVAVSPSFFLSAKKCYERMWGIYNPLCYILLAFLDFLVATFISSFPKKNISRKTTRTVGFLAFLLSFRPCCNWRLFCVRISNGKRFVYLHKYIISFSGSIGLHWANIQGFHKI